MEDVKINYLEETHEWTLSSYTAVGTCCKSKMIIVSHPSYEAVPCGSYSSVNGVGHKIPFSFFCHFGNGLLISYRPVLCSITRFLKQLFWHQSHFQSFCLFCKGGGAGRALKTFDYVSLYVFWVSYNDCFSQNRHIHGIPMSTWRIRNLT